MKVTSNSAKQLQMLTFTAMYLAVIVVLESLLSGIPNVQLTVVLLMVFGAVFPKRMFLPFLAAYVLIDNFTGLVLIGSLDPIIIVPMFLGWTILVYSAHAIRRRPLYWQIAFGVLFAFVYGWIYLPAHMLRFGLTTFWPYLVADFPFELMMAASNLVTVPLLYPLLTTLLRKWPLFQS
jgi:hypothetical protein